MLLRLEKLKLEAEIERLHVEKLRLEKEKLELQKEIAEVGAKKTTGRLRTSGSWVSHRPVNKYGLP